MVMTQDNRQNLLAIVRDAVVKYGPDAVRREIHGAHFGYSLGAPRKFYPECLRDQEVRTLLRQYRNNVSPGAQNLINEALQEA